MKKDSSLTNERYEIVLKSWSSVIREKWLKKKKASGISPEFTELDQALEDIVERADEAQEELAAENEKKTERMLKKRR